LISDISYINVVQKGAFVNGKIAKPAGTAAAWAEYWIPLRQIPEEEMEIRCI
jgi:hypothetical protein